MVSVVEKWATTSRYFDLQLEIVDRCEKASLEQVFRESIQAVKDQPLDDFHLYIKAARNAENRFQKALYGGNIFVSLLKRICAPFYNKSLIATHNEFIGALASRAAEHYRNYFEGLVEEHKRARFEDKIFLDAVIRVAEDKLLSRVDTLGFFYKVFLDNVFHGYIIGTSPFTTPVMLQDDRFEKIMESCSELWIETPQEEQRSLWKRIKPFLFGKDKHSEMYSKLISIAQKQGISIEKITSSGDGKSRDSVITSSPRLAAQSSPRRKSSNPIKIHTEYVALELIEAWQQGDENYVKTLVEGDLHPLISRASLATKLQELFGSDSDLLHKIRESKKTFCLALDASVVVAGKGLLDLLQSNEFEVLKFHWIE